MFFYHVLWRVQELDDVHRAAAVDHDDVLHLALLQTFVVFCRIKNTFWNLNFNKLKRLRKEIGETYFYQLDDSLSWKILQGILNAYSSYLASLFRIGMTTDMSPTHQLGLIPI